MPQPAELHLPAGGHPVLARRRVRHPSHWPNAKPPFSPYGGIGLLLANAFILRQYPAMNDIDEILYPQFEMFG